MRGRKTRICLLRRDSLLRWVPFSGENVPVSVKMALSWSHTRIGLEVFLNPHTFIKQLLWTSLILFRCKGSHVLMELWLLFPPLGAAVPVPGNLSCPSLLPVNAAFQQHWSGNELLTSQVTKCQGKEILWTVEHWVSWRNKVAWQRNAG